MRICTPFTGPATFKEVRGVIFDVDGVILDSRDGNRMFYNILRERVGLLPITPEEEEYVHAHSLSQSLARVIPGEKMDEAREVLARFDYAEILPFLYLQDGLIALLDYLFAARLPMAVNTNRTNTMDMVLDAFGLRRYFSPVITTAKVSRPKPSPEGVNKILSQWGLPAQAVVYIGDSVLDERTAKAAGTPFWSYRNPHLIAALHIPDFPTLTRCWKSALGLK